MKPCAGSRRAREDRKKNGVRCSISYAVMNTSASVSDSRVAPR
jgi:hypothetical protein